MTTEWEKDKIFLLFYEEVSLNNISVFITCRLGAGR